MAEPSPASIVCPVCRRASWHPVDVATGWCGACESFTGKTAEQVKQIAARYRLLGEPHLADTIGYRLAIFGARAA